MIKIKGRQAYFHGSLATITKELVTGIVLIAIKINEAAGNDLYNPDIIDDLAELAKGALKEEENAAKKI